MEWWIIFFVVLGHMVKRNVSLHKWEDLWLKWNILAGQPKDKTNIRSIKESFYFTTIHQSLDFMVQIKLFKQDLIFQYEYHLSVCMSSFLIINYLAYQYHIADVIVQWRVNALIWSIRYHSVWGRIVQWCTCNMYRCHIISPSIQSTIFIHTASLPHCLLLFS